MTTANRGWAPQPHPCPTCGKLTIFRQCDACFAQEVALATSDGPMPLPPLAQAMVRAEELRLRREADQLGRKPDNDEFKTTLEQVKRAPERTPQTRFWSGMCLWCAREIREQSGDDNTHMPPLHRIRNCYRHSKASLALRRWLAIEENGQQNRENGQKGGAM